MSTIFKKHYPLFILFILMLPVVVPLFKPYVSGTADGLGHRFRLVSFYNSLRQGIIRPRWAKEAALGYGAPTFLFNYPLPYYIGSAFLAMGFTVNRSGQLLSSLALLLSGIAMYHLGKKLTGSRMAGLIAGIFYLYAPYHLLMTYLYDAWGEILAFVFPPLIVYFIICLISQIRKKRYFVVLTILWFLFILSHNVSAVMFTPVILFLTLIISRFQLKPLLPVLNSFILGVIISAFFWLPAFVMQYEMKYPRFLAGEAAMRGSFFKSFSFQTDTAIKVMHEGLSHYLDFTIGLPILVVVFIGLINLIRLISQIRKTKKFPVLAVGLLILSLFCIYFTNYLSNRLWGIFYFRYILYPFRFLFPASFAAPLLAGIIFAKYFSREFGKIFGVIILLFAILQGLPFTKPYIDILPFPDSYFRQKQTFSSAPGTLKNMLIQEFLPVGADTGFLRTEEQEKKIEEMVVTKGKGSIKILKSGSEKLTADAEAQDDIELTVNRFYFPNWSLAVDGKPGKIVMDEKGRMKISLPKGNHNLALTFGQSRIEKIAYTVSGIGILLLIGEVWLWKSEEKFTSSHPPA